MNQLNTGLIIIATGKYDRFIEPLLESARIHFLPGKNVTFFLFTDSLQDRGEDVVVIPIVHEPWPGPTIHRYANIIKSKSMLSRMDYLFYVDADSLFVNTVGEEILRAGLTAVLHPGFAMFPGKGSWGNNHLSTSYTPINKRKIYACGGVQGGSATAYLAACNLMAMNIEEDERNGVMPEFHDETMWNKLLSDANYHLLDPSYCMVEELEKRALWRIDHLKPKLLALAKNHNEVRG